MSLLSHIPVVGRFFRKEVKESWEFTPDDPRYQRMFSAYLGLFYQVDRMARARGGKVWEWPLDERMIFIARGLMRYNPIAQGMINSLRTYTLGCKGLRVEVLGDTGHRKDASYYLDMFKDREDWWSWEREIYDRVHIEGESFTHFFPTEDCVTIRPIEPEWVLAPDGTEEWTFGCHNVPGDVQTIDAYSERYGQHYDEIDAEEVYHIKSKLTPRAEKRGHSDFQASCQLLDDSFKLWRNFLQSEAVRQGIIYFSKQAEGVTGQDLESAIAAVSDYAPPSPTRGTRMPPVSLQQGAGVEMLTAGTELAAVPSPEAMQGTVAGVNSAILVAGRPYNMPLWLISGDMNQNNVVDLGHESPFGSAIQDEQAYFSRQYRNIFMRVLAIGVQQGHLPESLLDNVDVQVSSEQKPQRDPNKATERLQKLYQDRIISKRTWTTQEGFDRDEEDEQIEKEGDTIPDREQTGREVA